MHTICRRMLYLEKTKEVIGLSLIKLQMGCSSKLTTVGSNGRTAADPGMVHKLTWLIDWLVGWLAEWLIDWLIKWLVGWSVDRLIGWLVA